MRAFLLTEDLGLSWLLTEHEANVIGADRRAHVQPPGIQEAFAAAITCEDGEWVADARGGTLQLSRRGRPLHTDTPLVDGDRVIINGVPLIFELEVPDEPEREVADLPVFLVGASGFAYRLQPGVPCTIGDDPTAQVVVRTGGGGISCRLFDVDGAWWLSCEAGARVVIAKDGARHAVHGREPLTSGMVIEVEEAGLFEFVDMSKPAATEPRTARAPRDDGDAWVAGRRVGVGAEHHSGSELFGQPGSLSLDDMDPDPPLGRGPQRSERRLVVEELPTGVLLWTDAGSVGVDTSQHDLCLVLEGGHLDRYGATRAGLGAARRTIFKTLHPRPFNNDVMDTVGEALRSALRRTAQAAAPGAEAAEVHVADVAYTPLVVSRGVLAQPHLLDDVVRFTPCAVAVARIEDDPHPDGATPEQAERLAHRLKNWRELFLVPGGSVRAVNKALNDFGEDAHEHLLWGLRHVRLTAPIQSLQHMELLCALGRHPYTGTSLVEPRMVELVTQASATEIGEALVVLDEGDIESIRLHQETPVETLAGLLMMFNLEELGRALQRRVRLPDVFASALYALRDQLRLHTETLKPPIPLPRVPGLRFLESLSAVADEGRVMQHCVVMCGPRAVAGESYLFHYEEQGEHATIEVDANGEVLQCLGPRNQKNIAAYNAEVILKRWGRVLQLAGLGPLHQSLWSSGGPDLPSHLAPLRTMGDLVDAYTTLAGVHGDGQGLLMSWAVLAAQEALAGRVWLAAERGPDPVLRTVLADGALLSSSLEAISGVAAHPTRGGSSA